MNLLVCDIDGSLVAESDNPFEPDASLPPNLPMCALVASLSASDDWYVLLLTSRPEKYLQGTTKFIMNCLDDMDELVMREENNWQTAPDFKIAKITAIAERLKPSHIVCIDSRTDVCAAYREQGYMVLEPFK